MSSQASDSVLVSLHDVLYNKVTSSTMNIICSKNSHILRVLFLVTFLNLVCYTYFRHNAVGQTWKTLEIWSVYPILLLVKPILGWVIHNSPPYPYYTVRVRQYCPGVCRKCSRAAGGCHGWRGNSSFSSSTPFSSHQQIS